jgi:hypothetical protein
MSGSPNNMPGLARPRDDTTRGQQQGGEAGRCAAATSGRRQRERVGLSCLASLASGAWPLGRSSAVWWWWRGVVAASLPRSVDAKREFQSGLRR